jgi:hypothetical protein
MQACMWLPLCVIVCLRALLYDNTRVFVYVFIQECEHTCLCSCMRACSCIGVGREDCVYECVSLCVCYCAIVYICVCMDVCMYVCKYV